MGTIQHDLALVVAYDKDNGFVEPLRELLTEMPEKYRHLIVGPIDSAANGYVFYAFFPDGSKEWWDTSDECQEWREKFVATARGRRGIYPIVQVSFGEIGDTLKVEPA